MRWSRYRPSRQKLAPDQLGYAEPLEKEISGAIRSALEQIGFRVSTTSQTRASRQTIGMPDLWVTHAAWGIAAWLEVKRPGQKPTRVQREWHDETRAAGVNVLVVTSAKEAVEAVCELKAKARRTA